MESKAIADSRLHPGVYLLTVKRNFAVIDAAVSAVTQLDYSPLCENMTSSTKPEVHHIATPPEKFGPCSFRDVRAYRETDGQTDRQTYMYTLHYFAPSRGIKLCFYAIFA